MNSPQTLGTKWLSPLSSFIYHGLFRNVRYIFNSIKYIYHYTTPYDVAICDSDVV